MGIPMAIGMGIPLGFPQVSWLGMGIEIQYPRQLALWTGDREVAGSSLAQGTAEYGPAWQLPRASAIQHYNLTILEARWCSAARKVIVGLALMAASTAVYYDYNVTCGLTA